MRANPQPERRIQVTSPGAGWSRANRRGAVPRGDVLVATWGGGGNLPPLLSVGQLLVLNGHRVRVLASGATRRAAEQAGFETVPYRCSQDPEMTVAFESQAARLLATMAGPEIAADVRYWLSELNPGLFVADCMLPAALTAAQVAGTPAVSVVHFLYGPARRHMIATGRGGMVDVPQLNLTRGALGLPVVAHPLEAWEAADLVLVTAPRWFDLDGSPPAHVVHAGPLGVHRKPAPTTGRRSGRPLVLISFSTTVMDRQSEVVQAVCSGCAELGVDALVTLGPGNRRAVAARYGQRRDRPVREPRRGHSRVCSRDHSRRPRHQPAFAGARRSAAAAPARSRPACQRRPGGRPRCRDRSSRQLAARSNRNCP